MGYLDVTRKEDEYESEVDIYGDMMDIWKLKSSPPPKQEDFENKDEKKEIYKSDKNSLVSQPMDDEQSSSKILSRQEDNDHPSTLTREVDVDMYLDVTRKEDEYESEMDIYGDMMDIWK